MESFLKDSTQTVVVWRMALNCTILIRTLIIICFIFSWVRGKGEAKGRKDWCIYIFIVGSSWWEIIRIIALLISISQKQRKESVRLIKTSTREAKFGFKVDNYGRKGIYRESRIFQLWKLNPSTEGLIGSYLETIEIYITVSKTLNAKRSPWDIYKNGFTWSPHSNMFFFNCFGVEPRHLPF